MPDYLSPKLGCAILPVNRSGSTKEDVSAYHLPAIRAAMPEHPHAAHSWKPMLPVPLPDPQKMV